MENTFMARKMDRVRPNQNRRFMGCGRIDAAGMPAGVRTGTGARARSVHGYACAREIGAAQVQARRC